MTVLDAPAPSEPLEFTPEVAERTQHLYERVESVIPACEWPVFAPEIDAILRLKHERNAVVLAHNYQTPEIFHGVADIVGDSLALAQRAAATDAEVIVLAGVHFMADILARLAARGERELEAATGRRALNHAAQETDV